MTPEPLTLLTAVIVILAIDGLLLMAVNFISQSVELARQRQYSYLILGLLFTMAICLIFWLLNHS